MILQSPRLRIEPIRSTHAELVLNPLQNRSLYTYLPEEPPTAEALARRYGFLEKGRSPDGTELWLNWVAFLRDSTTPIATFQATLSQDEMGSFAYIVFHEFWRQGYAREMAVCVLTHLFETYGRAELFAEMDTRNAGSIGLVESLGFTRVSTTKDADFFKGASSDEHRYSISRSTWDKRHGGGRQRRHQGDS